MGGYKGCKGSYFQINRIDRLRCVWCTSVLSQKWVSAIIDILNKHNWSKILPFLADLIVVTLR